MKNRFVAFAAALIFAAFTFGITACSELFEEKDVYPQMESLVVADGSPVVSPDQDDKTVTVSDEKVLSAEINEEGKLVITPLKPGSAEVSFFDSKNNTYVTYEFEVTSKGRLVQSSEPKSVPREYTVSISAMTHGSVTADKTTAHAGDTVTLTAIPDEGYRLGTYTVTSGGQAVSVSGNTFTMPAGNVTVTATFVPKTYGVGDVLLKDGSIIYYENVSGMTAEQKENAIGVLYALDENGKPRGWLGVYNSIQKKTGCWLDWAKAHTTGFNTKFEDIICTPSTSGEGAASTATFTGDIDGSDNWAYICSIDPTASANAEENYPGFHYVNTYAQTFNLTGDYADGWYMPSIAELCYIYRNKDTVNEVITALEGTPLLEDGYLSSSQSTTTDSVWHIDLKNGSLSINWKYINPLICCVRKFTEGD